MAKTNSVKVSDKPFISVHTSDYSAFKTFSNEFGAKAAGLCGLPNAWVPECIFVSVQLHKIYTKSGKIDVDDVPTECWHFIEKKSAKGECIIIRSSGNNETIQDRGKFMSTPLSLNPSKETVIGVITEIFDSVEDVKLDLLGLIFQVLIKPTSVGHLSNENRVSKTCNQWKSQYEFPDWSPALGCNSQRDSSPNEQVAIPVLGVSAQKAFRQIGAWLATNCTRRCHVEFVRASNKIWLVQLDIAWPELDTGANPIETLKERHNTFEPPNANCKIFKLYKLGSNSGWNKLENLNMFDYDLVGEYPKLYFATAELIHKWIVDDKSCLKNELSSLTSERAVIRTDSKNSGFNFPRTETLSSADAVDWLENQIISLEKNGTSLSSVVFIMHAFIPAMAGAWAYAEPNEDIVTIDALWGLPDGLQCLAHDSFEFDTRQQRETSNPANFKDMYLEEKENGEWLYQNVATRYGRSRSLGSPDVKEIANRTKLISEKLNKPAQIMWFCGIPEKFKIGKNIPWYFARESVEPAPRIDNKYKPFRLQKPEDLSQVPNGNICLEYRPLPDFIRDNDFLHDVINLAKKRDIPVSLRGSPLGHAYYLMRKAEIAIHVEAASKYKRVRGKQNFGKIVRDKIPEKISKGGEQTRIAILREAHKKQGLAAKLLEELFEYLDSNSQDEITSELGDVYEVLQSLAENEGIDFSKIETKAEKKKNKMGGFSNSTVLFETAFGKREQFSPDRVSLTEFSHISVRETEIEIPFYNLMSGNREVSAKIKIGEASFLCGVKINGGGLVISFLEDDDEIDEQLDLPF